ncbi:uncharacterized protein BYT42DRAFT_618011 [Radiomyces spectabilis]|uniref:uncharacterized protein n=1 Tax=Radiomyces spectabilis TaxID=64574 RepID=UPI0022201AC1|nr:uncharacterized protein BYT42DRAFT_618011 [Radiomyces spectabilis]KAI8367592.1 hypothetical protein BYT42DRAFT_618011 [Radiomyces spectabilis]
MVALLKAENADSFDVSGKSFATGVMLSRNLWAYQTVDIHREVYISEENQLFHRHRGSRTCGIVPAAPEAAESSLSGRCHAQPLSPQAYGWIFKQALMRQLRSHFHQPSTYYLCRASSYLASHHPFQPCTIFTYYDSESGRKNIDIDSESVRVPLSPICNEQLSEGSFTMSGERRSAHRTP